MATSIREFWNIRWHQLFRQSFVMFGARPGGALLGRPGAVAGAFTVSVFIHAFGGVGAGRWTDTRVPGDVAFFFIGLGAIAEGVFERATGWRVGGRLGWLWTMCWTVGWGVLIIDGWARRGIYAVRFFPDQLRPGKMIVNGAISLFRK
jgi:hypothetical protein